MLFLPLAGGFLTGKYVRGEYPPAGSRGDREGRFRETYLTDENFDVLETIRDVGDALDASPVQLALAWLRAHSAVTAPVIGPRTVSQLEENLASADLKLTDDQFTRLDVAAPAPY